VLDLLIHDIDIVMNIVKHNVVLIEATGSSVYSNIADIAVVHIVFENSTVANMLVSRVTQKKERNAKYKPGRCLYIVRLYESRYKYIQKGPINAYLWRKRTEIYE